MLRLMLVVLALYALCCAMALGQTAGRSDNAPPPGDIILNPATGALSVTRSKPLTDAPPPSIGTLMQHSGGSLLRASLMSGVDAERAKLNNISLLSVSDAKPKTVKKHELVTIIVREDSNFSSQGTSDLKKNATFDAKINAYPKVSLNRMSIQGTAAPGVTPELNMEGDRNLKGEATVDRTDTMTARVTAEVIDVKPNGTLVLQARKRIKTDEELQEFVFTGICRAEDITPDNTVLSTQVYDMEFQKNHSGAVRDTTKRGWIPKLLDFVSPF